MMNERVVHGLWVKGPLSPMELLTIRSFIHHGYSFFLWSYETMEYSLPQGAVQMDAREIIREEEVFTYRNINQFGHGKGSLAGFSDIFRYGLLNRYGGWWTDMDVTCLSRLDFDGPYVFRAMKRGKIAVGNLMYAEPNSELMAWCFAESRARIGPENRDWLLPVRILNKGIFKFRLEKHILQFTNPDSWPLVSKFLRQDAQFSSWRAIHWMNEEFSRMGLSKHLALRGSAYAKLLMQHEIPFTELEEDESREYLNRLGLWNYLKANWKQIPLWLIRGRI